MINWVNRPMSSQLVELETENFTNSLIDQFNKQRNDEHNQ